MTARSRLVLRHLRPYGGRVAVGIALVTITSLVELAKPWPLKIAVDNVLGDRPLPLLGYPERLGPEGLLAIAVFGLVGLHVLLGVLSLLGNRLTIDVGQRMVQALRGELFDHLEKLSTRFHDRRSAGELVYRLAADTMALQTLAMNAVFPTLSALLFLAGMAIVMLQMNVGLTLLALAVTPVVGLAVRVLGRRLSEVAAEARERESELYAAAERSMTAIRVTRAFSAEAAEAKRFRGASAASLARHLELYTTQTAYGIAVSILGAVGAAAVLWIGTRLVMRGSLTVGDLLVFTSYLASLYAPIQTLSHTFGLVQEARSGLGRVFSVLEIDPEVRDGARGLDPAAVRGAIELRNVEFAYEPGLPVLQDFSLEIAPGEKLALVGASGSGKTTTALLCLRFFDPSAGTILLDGEGVRAYRLDALRSAFGVVLQPPLLFPGTLRENLVYGRAEAGEAEIAAAIETAQLGDLIARLPEGLETVVGWTTLSAGERQRVTVARALVRRAPILLLDEPTASLDVDTEARLLAALEAHRRGRTCLLITHSRATLEWADRIAVLQDGRIAAVGRLDELRAQGGLAATLLAEPSPAGRSLT
ncbi:MAG: ABC transporter ATP-binding protein [Deltaproteobacteria bacterium]|nr:ABC transporter ATP-binding protein [Deltaproteobacteria bacterium]